MTPEEMIRLAQSPQGLQWARDFLSAAQRLDAMIALRLSQLDAARARGEKMTRAADALRGSGLSDRVGEAAAELADLEEKLLEEYQELLRRQKTILEIIRRVPDEQQQMVLEMRYLQGISFVAIAQRMHYDERQIYRFHERGLRHVAALMAAEGIPFSS